MALEFRSALRTLFSESLCCLRFSKKLCSLQTQVQTSSGSDISLQGHISPSSTQKGLPGELTSQSWPPYISVLNQSAVPPASRCPVAQISLPSGLPETVFQFSHLLTFCPDGLSNISGSFSLIDYSQSYRCGLWRKNHNKDISYPNHWLAAGSEGTRPQQSFSLSWHLGSSRAWRMFLWSNSSARE